jgi:hypothetical protein
VFERLITDLAPEPRPAPANRFTPSPTLCLGDRKEAQRAADDRDDAIAKDPGRKEQRVNKLYHERKGVIEEPHQHQKYETQDLDDGKRDNNERHDDYIVKGRREAIALGQRRMMISGHGAVIPG